MKVSMTGYHSRCSILSIIHLPRFLTIHNVAQDGPAYVSRHKKGTLQIRPPCPEEGSKPNFRNILYQQWTDVSTIAALHDRHIVV